MTYDNFMIQDLIGTLVAFCLFPLFLLIPGYVLGWFMDVLSFRRRGFATRIPLGIALSVAVCPILTYLMVRIVSFAFVWVIYAATWLTFLVLVANNVRRSGFRTILTIIRRSHVPILIISAWIVVATFSLIDFQAAGNLYISVVSGSGDYTKHVAVTDAITRTGIPPINPSFFPGYPVELFYYYFWFLMCSLVDRLGGSLVTARLAVFASAIWIGIALMAVVSLYLWFLKPDDHKRVRSTVTIGMGLLLISGLDIIPVSVRELSYLITRSHGRIYDHVEHWNEQITSWLNAVLWVPHHVASLLACLTGLLLLQSIRHTPRFRDKILVAIISSFAFASAAGLSIWVTFIAAIFLAVWVLISFTKKWYCEAGYVVLIGLVAALLSIPFLLDLCRANQLDITPIALTIRPFKPAERILDHFGISDLWIRGFTMLLLLPVNYFMELGFFGVAAIIYWKERLRLDGNLDRGDTLNVTVFFTSLFICTFLKSTIKNNDLGWRGFMFAQFVLLIWSVDLTMPLFDQLSKKENKKAAATELNWGRYVCITMTSLLMIGAMTVTHDLVMSRVFPVLQDVLSPNEQWGRRTYATRQVYQWIRNELPNTAVVQHNPDIPIHIFNGLYGDRQVVAADDHHGALYGIPYSSYDSIASRISQVFSIDNRDFDQIDDLCQEFSISALVVKDTDPVWSNHQSWVWKRKPLFGNDFAKVFACRSEVPP